MVNHEVLHALAEYLSRTVHLHGSDAIRNARLCCSPMRNLMDDVLRHVTVQCSLGGGGLLRSALEGGRLHGLRWVTFDVREAADDAVAMLHMLRELPHLEGMEVRLADMCGATAVADSVAAVIRAGRLQTLYIGDSKLGAAGAQVLADGVASRSAAATLREVIILDCDYGEGAVCNLARGVAQLTSLERIWIDGTLVGPVRGAAAGAQALGDALQDLHQLRSMRVCDVCTGSAGASALALAIGNLTKLTEVDLGSNHLWAASLAVIAPALAQLPMLESLRLEYNLMADDGLLELATCFADAKGASLRSLNIGCNDITSASNLHAWMATAPCKLTELVLSVNPLKAKGVRSLARVLKLPGAAQMQRLNLGQTSMRRAGALALLGSLTTLRGLQDLTLCSTVPEVARRRVSAALPWVQSIRYE